MQYNAPNRMYVFQIFPDPFWCCDSEPGPLPTEILAARLLRIALLNYVNANVYGAPYTPNFSVTPYMHGYA